MEVSPASDTPATGGPGLPWVDHLRKVSEPPAGSSLPLDAISNVMSPGLPDDGSAGTSLLDGVHGYQDVEKYYPDVNVSIPLVGAPAFNTPNRYEDDQASHWWWRSRERVDQNTGTPFDGERTAGALFGVRMAKTLTQILYDNRNHKKKVMDDRGQKLIPAYREAVRRVSPEDKARGLYLLEVFSPDSGKKHTTAIQFLKPSSGTKKKLLDHDCFVGCDCDAFLYWGAQYYAVQGNYMYTDLFRPTLVAPKEYLPGVTKEISRGQHGTYCKHIFAAAHALSGEAVGGGLDLQEEMVHMREPLYDAAKVFEEAHIGSREDFVSAVAKGAMPPALKAELADLLDNGTDMQTFYDSTREWVHKMPLSKKVLVLHDLAQAPSLIFWLLLLEGKERTVSDELLDAGWLSIKWLVGSDLLSKEQQ